jgi:catechol 2,3-dioxygenase-like lactoylglutathione lyase family enzyme
MIGYVTLGTNDIAKARDFYDNLMPLLGARQLMRMDSYLDGYTMWGTSYDAPCLAITNPFDGNAATVGNGAMVALFAGDRATVDKVYAHALALGATDDGAPGLRGPEGPSAFYGGYFRDLDGNKLCAFATGPAA